MPKTRRQSAGTRKGGRKIGGQFAPTAVADTVAGAGAGLSLDDAPNEANFDDYADDMGPPSPPVRSRPALAEVPHGLNETHLSVELWKRALKAQDIGYTHGSETVRTDSRLTQLVNSAVASAAGLEDEDDLYELPRHGMDWYDIKGRVTAGIKHLRESGRLSPEELESWMDDAEDHDHGSLASFVTYCGYRNYKDGWGSSPFSLINAPQSILRSYQKSYRTIQDNCAMDQGSGEVVPINFKRA